MKVILVLIAAFVSLVACNPADVCVHDIVTRGYEPRQLSINPLKKRFLAALPAQWRPINVQFDYAGLEGLDSVKAEFLMNDLLPKVGEFISSYLSVKYVPGEKWAFPYKECHKHNVTARYRQPVISADVVIFVTWKNETNETYRAWASSCLLDSINNRPKAGQINFNWKTLSTSMGKEEFRALFHTATHELTHVLGLSGSHLPRFVDEHGNKLAHTHKKVVKRGFNTTIVTLPKVIDHVRKYFDCPTADGAELENQGGSGSLGSHWERRIFTNEFMTAASRKDHRLTNLTLSLLDSTGWYKVDYSVAGQTTFGKGAGCGFLNTSCFVDGKSQYKGWCSLKESMKEGCDFKHMGKSSCGLKDKNATYDEKNKSIPLPEAFNYFNGGLAHDHYADNCPYYRPYSNGMCGFPENHNEKKYSWLYDETYGPGSRCFSGNYFKEDARVKGSSIPNHGTCHRYRCHTNETTKTTQVVIQIGKDKKFVEVYCPPEGGKAEIRGYKGHVNCPIGEEFCKDETLNTCPHLNFCSDIGHCYRGKCICPKGFDTKTCETPKVDCNTNNCSGHGECYKSRCVCDPGWGGAECAKPRITTKCKMCRNGICYGGQCLESLTELSAHLQGYVPVHVPAKHTVESPI